jgi:hypothetical protein
LDRVTVGVGGEGTIHGGSAEGGHYFLLVVVGVVVDGGGGGKGVILLGRGIAFVVMRGFTSSSGSVLRLMRTLRRRTRRR